MDLPTRMPEVCVGDVLMRRVRIGPRDDREIGLRQKLYFIAS